MANAHQSMHNAVHFCRSRARSQNRKRAHERLPYTAPALSLSNAPWPANSLIINGEERGDESAYNSRTRWTDFHIPSGQLDYFSITNSNFQPRLVRIKRGRTYYILTTKSLETSDSYGNQALYVTNVDPSNNTIDVSKNSAGSFWDGYDTSQDWGTILRNQLIGTSYYIDELFTGVYYPHNYGFRVLDDETFTFTGLTPNATVEIGVNDYYADPTGNMWINDVPVVRDLDLLDIPEYSTVDSYGNLKIRLQRLNDKYMLLHYIKVNGKVLKNETVDFNYRTDVQPVGAPTVFVTEGYASFDTDTGGRFGASVGDGADLTFDPPVPVTTKLTFDASCAGGSVDVIINDGEATGAYPTSRGIVDVPFTGNVSKIRIIRTAGYDATYTYSIRFDGKLLLDTTEKFISQSTVSSETTGGQGNIAEINTSDNTVFIQNTGPDTDRWIGPNNSNIPFAVAGGSLANPPAPGYLDVVYTSMNADTTPFTGVDATLSSRTWTLETAPDKSGPWNLLGTYEEFDMTASQDGATPWTTGKPILAPGTWYRVKVAYNSTAAESVESAYHTFKTGV